MPLEESLLREQYHALTQLVPVLYCVVILATLALSFGFSDLAPTWLSVGVPMAMMTLTAVRLRYWFAQRRIGRDQDLAIIRRDVRSTAILGPALSFGFTLVGIAIASFAGIFLQSLALVTIWMTAVGSAFCLTALRSTSQIVVLVAGIPMTIWLIASGSGKATIVSGIFGVVSLLIIHILRMNHDAFRNLVRQRYEIEEKHQLAEQARAEATVMAYTDYLTGLSNRRHFEHLLKARVDGSDSAHEAFAIGIIDLDGFKPINDMHGHGIGDAVLCEVALRLGAVMEGHGRVARIGGDEFAVLAENIATDADATRIAGEIADALAKPYRVRPEDPIELSCSMGFALYPQSSTDPERLIDQADMALHKVKTQARGTIAVFSARFEDEAMESARIEQALRRAIAENTLTVSFQPIIDLGSDRLTGFEALARWTDPVMGPVPPSVFIPISERAGLVEALTDQLLTKAARTAAQWPDGLVLSFNLSSEQLVKENAGPRIIAILDRAGLPADRFEAEVTESALMRDLAAAHRTIVHLKDAGARVSLDDFGTGYSSLSQIRDLPIDKVKIDKSFVDSIVSDTKMAGLVRAIVSMCDKLELNCVAEGIEEQGQLDALRAHGCEGGQGFLFSRPVPEEDLASFITSVQAGRKAA